MSRRPSRRHTAATTATTATVALVLGLFLLAPCAALAQPHGTVAAPAELLTRVWSVLSQLWDGTGTTANRQLALSSPAPGGEPSSPVAASTPPPLENGCGLDPDGHCVD
jgi:hypothetical protein